MVVDDIYKFIKKTEEMLKPQLEEWRTRYFTDVFQKIFPKNKFDTLIEETECYYCKTPIEKIRELISSGKIYKKNERGWNLEIDRKEPNQEYTNDNCVVACYWCNNAKTDEFTAEEFKPIGEAIGKAIWGRLLKD